MTQQLKPGWTWVRLGDVATEYSKRVEPTESDFDRFVGSNHIGRFDLVVRNWGSTDEVTSTMKAFQPGDYLFVRRSLYASDFRERAARADFAGLCSGDILTIRERKNVVADGFLTAVLNQPRIWEYVVAHATGSITRRIKWKQLANYELALPPLEEQRRIAALLQSIEANLQELYKLKKKLIRVRIAMVEDSIKQATSKVAFRELLLDSSYGSSKRANQDQRGVPILRIPNVLRDEIDLSNLKWVELTKADINRYSVGEGDILIVRTNGNPDYVGRCVVAHDPVEPLVYASYLIRLRVNREIVEPDYVSTVLNSPTSRQHIRGSVRSSAGNYNLNTEGIGRQQIPLLDISGQRNLLGRLSMLQAAKVQIDEKHHRINQLEFQIFREMEG